MKQIFFLLLSLLGFASFGQGPFHVPETLKDNFDFWLRIYTEHPGTRVVFFDDKDLTVIYGVLDLPLVPGEISSPKYKPQVKARFQEIQKHLRDLSEGIKPTHESEDYKHIKKVLVERKLLGTPDLDKRLRHQSGLKNQFALGLKLSGLYMDDIKAILKSQGLPHELAALVMVESLCLSSAESHKGAKGLWGIMPETGRALQLQINDFVDERGDWQKSTLAAARFIKRSYGELGEWGSTITSYNYGLNGMRRAKASLGSSDIGRIVEEWESPIFGFASKNYYAECAAAHHVYENAERYFPGVIKDKPKAYELVQLQKPVLANDLYEVKALSREELASLNPSFTAKTLKGEEVIPAEYSLRVPQGKAKHFLDRIKKINPKRQQAAEKMICGTYLANGKESLGKIAKKKGLKLPIFAKMFNKPESYKPTKGKVRIRSHLHDFSQLKEIAKLIAQGRKPPEVAESEPVL